MVNVKEQTEVDVEVLQIEPILCTRLRCALVHMQLSWLLLLA